MAKRKTLTPAEYSTILLAARVYVNTQLETMARYGSRPELTDERYEKLVSDCAKPAIAIALWQPSPPRDRALR